MPWKPVAACRHQGCPNKQVGNTGYCSHHQSVSAFKTNLRLKELKERQLAASPEKREAHAFYISKRWRRLRQLQLNSEPLCRECGAPGKVVDHIKQISRGGARYEMTNLQTLCSACHNQKRARESASNMNEKKQNKGSTSNV